MIHEKELNNQQEDDDYPIIFVKLSPTKKSVRYYCQTCRRYHTHGLDPYLRRGEPSHRGTHCCNPKSPYFGRGYYIQLPHSELKKLVTRGR